MREWDGMDKRDQGYSRPGTGGISHGIPGHPTAKLDNPPFHSLAMRIMSLKQAMLLFFTFHILKFLHSIGYLHESFVCLFLILVLSEA